MASSNRHWPSMFKSKPCNNHHQWQHDINPSLVSGSCLRAPCSLVPVTEERSPEPKPRWNPKPEQIRILEAIFNSGMVNPPRDEIRRIRTQLQEYGQVGDANVFYWFQNRKSRSKHKQRHLQNAKTHQSQQTTTPITSSLASIPVITGPSSSSSSSEKSSPKNPIKTTFASIGSTNLIDASNSPTASVNQSFFQLSHGDTMPEPFLFPVQPTTHFTQGFCFSELSNVVQFPDHHTTVGSCPGFLLSELVNSKKMEEEKVKLQHQLSYTATTSASTAYSVPPTASSAVTIPSTINQIQGPAKTMVFINDVAFEVPVGPFNVREAFGDDAVLIHSSGQPILTNEYGVTHQSLQHGAFYYLI